VVCPEIFTEEDQPMTLQIAMVGKDGFVLASDTKATKNMSVLPTGRRQIGQTFKTTKIRQRREGGLICAHSGSDEAGQLAEVFVINAPAEFVDDQAVADYLIGWSSGATNMANQLVIVVVTKAKPGMHKLWRVYFTGQNPPPFVQWVDDRLTGGDEGNAALYFGERYYDPSKTVDDLALLAAHVILEGHVANPTGVEGLEVWIGRNGEEPEQLDLGKLDRLKTRSAAVHDSVKSQFISH